MNRRHLLRLTPLATLAACSDPHASSKATTGTPGTKPLIIGMDMTYPPFEFKDAKGEPDGVDVRIAEALAASLNRPLTLEPLPFEGLIAALKSGKIDCAISAMTASDDRRKSIDFSDPYAFTAIAMLVGTKTPIQSAADLAKPGTRFTAKLGTTGESFVRATYPDAPLTSLDDESACVLEVAQGRADAFIYDQLSILSYHLKNKDTTRALLQPIREEAWAIGLKKGNDSLLTGVNAFLKTFRESGGLAKLGDQYLASEKKLMESMGIPFILR
jgi:polar amino acid transport system substrate-binding protein